MNTATHRLRNDFKMKQSHVWSLWGCQLLNISLLAIELSSWMLAIIALSFCWQALLLSQPHISKNRNSVQHSLNVPSVFLIFFAISGCIVIAISSSELGLLLSMVHLLSFAYTLKSFEIKSRKDFYQLILLGLFLLASSLIFRQSLLFSFVIGLIFIVNIAVLLQQFFVKQSLVLSLKVSATLVLQSTVLAIVLFIIFPRISPFWQVPIAKSAKTGLSSTVSPGDIANLALSNELAFRVNFNRGSIPTYSQLYWRAMVLENYDGRKWTIDKKPLDKKKHIPFKASVTGNAISYEVIAETSFQPWLFALSVAQSSDTSVVALNNYTLQSKQIISQTKQYKVSSYLHSPLGSLLNDKDRLTNLAFPVGSNPKLEKLAQQLKSQHLEPLQIAQAILSTFREQAYFYTLQPPLLINNSLDQFYFDTKAGFCVHYASTFTYLMRASGVPARVVTGYLGGEYNGEGIEQNQSSERGHLSIYQYDAHAWSEIWIDKKGWVRFDPTAAVDPQRTSSGWSSALLQQQSSLNSDFISLYRFKQIAWLNKVRLQLDAIDYQWSRWVLGYSSKQQYNLLKNWFGDIVPWKISALIASALFFIMLLFILFYKFKSKSKTISSPWLKNYQLILNKIKAKGIIKPESMTTNDFTFEVKQHWPHLYKSFNELTQSFNILSYQQLSKDEQRIILIKMAKQRELLLKQLKKCDYIS